MYRHGIICSEKTHFYFKGGGGSSRILSTFLKMSFIALLTVTLCLSVSLRSYRNHTTCRTLHASKMNPLIITRLIIISIGIHAAKLLNAFFFS